MNKQRIVKLLSQATVKLSKKEDVFSAVLEDVRTLFDMLKQTVTGKYKKLSSSTIAMVVGALIYFVNPYDVVPDFIVGVGLLDDLKVLTLVTLKLKNEIEEFRRIKSQEI